MISSQDAIFSFTMAQEGGASISMDPRDNGNWSSGKAGLGTLIGSKYGVSAPDLIAYLDPQKVTVTAETMANITQDVAEAIWTPHYMTACMGASLPLGIDLMTVDFAYNRGTSPAGRTLQETAGMPAGEIDGWIGNDTIAAVNLAAAISSWLPAPSKLATEALQRHLGVTVDGVYGPITQKAMASTNQRARLWLMCARLADVHVADYHTLLQFPLYGAGWVNRVWASLDAALALADAGDA